MEESEVTGCITPWDVQSRQVFAADGVWYTLYAGQGGGKGYVLYDRKQRELPEPGDCQNKKIYDVNGVYRTLDDWNAAGGQVHGIVYTIEGNTVDRASRKNGRGWSENVSPTLNTQDRHAVVIAIEGNGARPSHLGGGVQRIRQIVHAEYDRAA